MISERQFAQVATHFFFGPWALFSLRLKIPLTIRATWNETFISQRQMLKITRKLHRNREIAPNPRGAMDFFRFFFFFLVILTLIFFLQIWFDFIIFDWNRKIHAKIGLLTVSPLHNSINACAFVSILYWSEHHYLFI